MRLSERLVGRKSFAEPPFWASDSLSGWASVAADKEKIGNDFLAYVQGAYKGSGVVFSTMLARQMLFSEARFAWRKFANGRPEPLFGTRALSLLERPWPSGTTGELLSRMIQDADLAGNFFATTANDDGKFGKASAGPGQRIVRMRPDWVTIVLGSKSGDLYDLDTRVIGYRYAPPVTGTRGGDPVFLLPSEVCHFSPLPDPEARFRGMSWLTPVLREIEADKGATKHKLNFFKRGATLSTIVALDKDISPNDFTEFVAKFKEQHEGADMAYKTLFLGGGADVTLNGADMKQIDFKATQGAGETRIAAAGGMHPVIVGLSEGLAGSSLNAGNFDAAKRLTADKTLRPLWRMASAALEVLTTPPEGAELWTDDRDIAFLRDDSTDLAAIASQNAQTLRTLTDGGWTAESAKKYLETSNIMSLEHSGYLSVQLQAPGSGVPTQQEA